MPRSLRPIAATRVDHERANAAAQSDFRCHAVRPEAVHRTFFERICSRQAEGHACGRGHRRDAHFLLRVDSGLDEHAPQAVRGAGRCADAKPLQGAQIAAPDAEVPAHDQEPVHVLRECAKQLATCPLAEGVERCVRGAADEVEPAVAQGFIGSRDRKKELDRRLQPLGAAAR